jgi:DNA-binding response OmpR family regulator
VRLLVVEDEERIGSFLEKGLVAEGYSVDVVRSGKDALAVLRDAKPALVVLDLGLPDFDGSEVLRDLRGRGDDTPVIILTARGEVPERVAGLDLGADDYLTKPFSFDELVARIRRRLRPAGRADGSLLDVGGIQLDLLARRATIAERDVDLSAREFSLLEAFMRHAGQVLSREQLLSQVWGFHFDPGTNVVDVYVGYLRRKLGDDVVETVRGMGYRFVGV